MTPVQAEILIANAKRQASEIIRHGWRPDSHEVQRLRQSTKHASSYLILGRAWQKAGLPLSTIRKLAGRAK